MTPVDVLAAALPAALVPGGGAEPVLAHRPDPGIDDDDEEDEERPIGDPAGDEDDDDDEDEDDEDDEDTLQVSG